MMKSTLPSIAVVLGFVLLIGSALWAVMFPASRGWTKEKGERMSELSAKSHALGFELTAAEKPNMHKGRSYAEVKAEADQVNAELKALDDELKNKVGAPARASTILKWSGVAFVVAGACIIFATRGG